jgi:hypothetical protein
MIKMIIDLDEGPLFSAASEAASNAGMTIDAWIMAAVDYKILRDQSANAAIGDYLIKIGNPSIWDEETEAYPCPQCSAKEFSAGGKDGDVTCTLCGATLIKRPPEWDEFIAGYRGDIRRGTDADGKEPWQ